MKDDHMGKKVRSVLERLLNEGIKPHAKEIATIAADGDVAIVVFEPGAGAARAAREAGWDGKAGVLRMSPEFRQQLIEAADAVTAAWLDRDAGGAARMFVFAGCGTLLVNYAPRRAHRPGWGVGVGF